MYSPISKIVRRITRGDKLNILTFPTHERYESGLALTGHNFYSYRAPDAVLDIKRDWNVKNGPIPDNYILINEIPQYVDFDLILSQNKFGQYQLSRPLSDMLKLPIVSLEHTLPVPIWKPEFERAVKKMRGDINIFISNYSINEWEWQIAGDTHVIHHMVNTDMFRPATDDEIRHDSSLDHGKNHLLSVVNDWVARDYCCNYYGWERISEGLPVRVIGDTEELSKPAATTQELVQEYQAAKIFLNTSTISPVPTSLLEAMACGCACVTTATCMIPEEVIEHGVNGLMSNDETELREYCQMLLEDDDLARKLGEAAIETIHTKFNKESFLNEWNHVFKIASRISK